MKKLIITLMRGFGLIASAPARFTRLQVRQTKHIDHENWIEFLFKKVDKPNMKILETVS
jgi:hypothetical protein